MKIARIVDALSRIGLCQSSVCPGVCKTSFGIDSGDLNIRRGDRPGDRNLRLILNVLKRGLARLLKNGKNQKIIATHSPDIVSAFDPELIVAVRDGGKVVQPTAQILNNDQRAMLRWWGRNKLEPLTARRVIAVEGAADRVILERVAELTGRDLDRFGISVVEAEGAGDMGGDLEAVWKSRIQYPSVIVD